MKRITFAIFLLFSLNGIAMAATCNGLNPDKCTQTPGCGYSDSMGCIQCPSNHYSTSTDLSCQTCPTYDEGSQGQSAEGSTTKEQCYRPCPPISIEHGTKNAENAKENYDINTEQYPTCKYNIITCDNESDQCNGFHYDAKTASCIANNQDCQSGKYTGVKFWQADDNNYSSCYITNCGEDKHLEDLHSICGFTYGNDCAANRGECNKKFSCDNGEVTGNYSWVDQYRFDDCLCVQDTDIENGKGEKMCHLEPGSNANKYTWSTTNCTTQVSSCNSGFCVNDANPNACLAALPGYYHDNSNTKECTACPRGATSEQGATNIDQCYLTRGEGRNVTQFCDDVGCFTIPVTNDIATIPYIGS